MSAKGSTHIPIMQNEYSAFSKSKIKHEKKIEGIMAIQSKIVIDIWL